MVPGKCSDWIHLDGVWADAGCCNERSPNGTRVVDLDTHRAWGTGVDKDLVQWHNRRSKRAVYGPQYLAVGCDSTACWESCGRLLNVRAWKNVGMEDQPVIGWHRHPMSADRFRYWNGSEWTAEATTEVHSNGAISIMAGGHRKRRPVRGSWLLRNTVVFHTLAWFDCSVPLVRGHLGRFMEPVEMRTLHQIQAIQTDS